VDNASVTVIYVSRNVSTKMVPKVEIAELGRNAENGALLGNARTVHNVNGMHPTW